MTERFDLSGRRALVTGSSRGIGRSIALGLAEAGADVAVHYAGRAEAAAEAARRIEAMGRRAITLQADLAADDAPRKIADQATAEFGPIDILVLNASIQILEPWQSITSEQYEQQMTINFRASLQLIQRLAPSMADRGWGRIVSVGSVQELQPSRHMLVYAASKSALENVVRNLAGELAPNGVTINNLSPGVIETERNAGALNDDGGRQRVLDNIPVGFIGQSEDCVGAALLLCTDAGRYITGSTLLVDGGWSLRK